MRESTMNQFLWGALTMGSGIVALFFLKFWSQTKDRLFAMFAAAFAVLALNWAVLGLSPPPDEARHFVYAIRLAAFALILAGVVDKNRRTMSQ
jgi:quinol-cytochrome oxidoreductase complex cytochrome b subunit